MITLVKIALSGNFWIGFIVASLAVVGYLYSTGSIIKWSKK
jgi:hypothetical protein